MEQIDPRHLLINIAKILEQLKIPYFITGGMAVLLWGRPRFTADIDIVVELKPDNVDSLERALMELGKEGYIDKESMQEALLKYGEFNFVDGETGVKVDFWVLRDNSFNPSCLKRRVVKNILGQKVYFISPEDLMLSKLNWYKQSESTRQLEDVESVLKISGEQLDIQYLKHWAKKLDTLDILNRLLEST